MALEAFDRVWQVKLDRLERDIEAQNDTRPDHRED